MKKNVKAGITPSGIEQPYCYPENLFSADIFNDERLWMCVRTKPRWEKKFARWLKTLQIPFYLPVYLKRIVSYRKSRVSDIPLFPGFVFVLGERSRSDFIASGCVVRIVKPESSAANRRLAEEIHAVWQMLTAGEHPVLVSHWESGQRIRVLNGPLAGVIGRYVRDGSGGSIVAWFDVLGVGASVKLDPDTAVEAVID